jgi:hypothetical protein
MRNKRIRNTSVNEIIYDNGDTLLCSYFVPVAAYSKEKGEYYRTTQHYSVTTSRHINAWLKGVNATPVSPDWLLNFHNNDSL